MNEDNKNVKSFSVIKDLIFSATNKISLAIMAGFFIIVLLILLFICVLPINQMFSDGSQIDAVREATSDSYDNAVVGNGSWSIALGLNEKYDCGGTGDNVYQSGDDYIYQTNSCFITIHTFPKKDDITKNINAYTSAVDGAIAQYYPEATNTNEGETIPDDELTTFDENGEVVLTEEGEEYLEQDEYSSSSSSSYEEQVEQYSGYFFNVDSNIGRWDFSNEHIEEEKEYVGCRWKGDLYEQTLPGNCLGEEVYQTKYIQYADVNVPIYYDLENYKGEILDEAASNMVGQIKYEEVMQEDGSDKVEIVTLDEVTARELLDETIENNYYNYFGGSQYEDRTVFFKKLVESGYLTFIPIYGVNLGIINGLEEGGESGYVESNMSGSAIWNTITSLRNHGTLSKSNTINYQCTSFAAYWFYKVYGYDILHGDGKYMADYLSNEDDAFSISSSPKAGGIFSIVTSSHGHVGGIDAIDYENKTITISEGNLSTGKLAGTSKTAVAIKQTYTFDGFLNHVKNICKAQGSNVCSIKYAVPN